MIRERSPHLTHNPRSVLTTGTFDGVHLGHQSVLRYLVERAGEADGVPTVVTFDPHPRQVISGDRVPLLTTLDERRALLESLGVERVVVLPFTRDLAEMSPEAYVRDVLLGSIGMREIVIGYDHRFGRKASGTRETLEGLAKTMGFGVDVMPAHVSNGVAVSSTGVRRLLIDEGDARAAAALLGRPYSLSGVVVRGNQRGRTIGFPTANVEPSESAKLIPKIGVYAVRATVAGGELIEGMMNIGRRPTFESDGAVSLEVHLFDFDAEIYGRSLEVHVVERVRDERRFDGPEALVAQLREDRGQAANALSGLV